MLMKKLWFIQKNALILMAPFIETDFAGCWETPNLGEKVGKTFSIDTRLGQNTNVGKYKYVQKWGNDSQNTMQSTLCLFLQMKLILRFRGVASAQVQIGTHISKETFQSKMCNTKYHISCI